MSSYNITVLTTTTAVTILKIGFGEPAQNDQIVRDCKARLEELTSSGELKGGELVLLNGPASLPGGSVLTHHLSHLYGAMGFYDPKLGKYVISVTHDPKYQFGSLVDG